MKALLTAFALLSFIAASTLPMTASADEMKSDQSTTKPGDTGSKPDADTSAGKGTMDTNTTATTHSNAHKTHKTATHKTTHHKKTTKKKTHHKHTASHKTKPKADTTAPKQG